MHIFIQHMQFYNKIKKIKSGEIDYILHKRKHVTGQ